MKTYPQISPGSYLGFVDFMHYVFASVKAVVVETEQLTVNQAIADCI